MSKLDERARAYDFRRVAEEIGVDYDKLERAGTIDRTLRNGVSEVIEFTYEREEIGLSVPTKARLTIGLDERGERKVALITEERDLDVKQYRGIATTEEQRTRLNKGENVLVSDPIKGDYVVAVDKELNRLAGVKRSSILVPRRLGTEEIGFRELDATSVKELRKGEAVDLEIGGNAYRAQVDPVERTYKLSVAVAKKQAQTKAETFVMAPKVNGMRTGGRLRMGL